MPIYEYRCRKCDRAFSELIYGEEKPTCPECGGHSAEKQFSSFGVGSGGGGSSLPCGNTPACGSGGL
ncbi:MAG: zinc ribbon domain-containing protein [Candidatus Eisenbacteria bacterium]